MRSRRSRVHPTHKTNYRVGNWPDYDRSLAERGSLTIWLPPDAVANAKPACRRRNRQRRLWSLAIEVVQILRLLFRLPLRQTVGFVRALFALMRLSLDVTDHAR
ncbi:MAG: transposase [Planctomycetota bacterium]